MHRQSGRQGSIAALVVATLLGACSVSVPVAEGGELDSELVAAGEALYAASCAECHGADLRGTERGPSHLSQVYAPNHHGDAAFLAAVQRGSPAHHWTFGDMPPIEGLDQEDATAIVAYVRQVQEREGLEPYPP